MAVSALNSSVQLLVGGSPRSSGAGVYELGQTEEPDAVAVDSGHCPTEGSERTCALARTPAALGRATSPSGGREQEQCFVSGSGRAGGSGGLWVRCRGGTEFTYPVPSDLTGVLVDSVGSGSNSEILALAADRAEMPGLAAGVAGSRRAFYYPPSETDPIDLLALGESPKSYGLTVAVGQTDAGRLIAVGAPEASQLWLFREVDGQVEALGCLEGQDGLALGLAMGDLNGDAQDDLAVADSAGVSTYSGAALITLPERSDQACLALADLPEGPLARLTCQEDDDISGCSRARFGVALTIGNFDGQGDGEVAVGAPRMAVRGEEDAGAVLIYDSSGTRQDTRILSTAALGDLFGTSLVTVPQSGRDVLASGAPGASGGFVVYCSQVQGEGMSPRCP